MQENRKEKRAAERTIYYDTDLAIIGGGMAGTSAAIAAARLGLKTILIQNRPVLGGPASTECDADSDAHLIVGGSNWTTRDARETGPIEEFRLTQEDRWQSGWRNCFSQVLREACLAEKNLTLFLNTEFFDLEMDGSRIKQISAKTMGSQLIRIVRAPFYLDCTGDGELGFSAGAEYRMGREAKSEFNESLAPDESDNLVLGSSIYFRAINTGKPVKFTPPPWAAKISEDMFIRRPHTQIDRGYWWLECGGDMDTISENEEIYQKLLSILYGVWDHIKNDGDHGADNYAIEWVAPIPAKRESRRLMGNYILTENDILQNKKFSDAAAHSGGNVDIHPSSGFFSGTPPCGPEHGYLSPGLYHIPFRCIVSKNISNLLMAGRNISVTHAALSSTRMMGTCSLLGQAAAGLAYLGKKYGELPADLSGRMEEFHKILYRIDHTIPGIHVSDPENLCTDATVQASSVCKLSLEKPEVSEEITTLYEGKMTPSAISFPAADPRIDTVEFYLENTVGTPQEVTAELVQENAMYDFENGHILAKTTNTISSDYKGFVKFDFSADVIPGTRYYIRLWGNQEVKVWLEETYLPAVWKSRVRITWPPQGDNKNLCVRFHPEQRLFEAENVLTTDNRGGVGNSVWISDPAQPMPQTVEITFKKRSLCGCAELVFDTNLDNINIYDYQKECVKEYILEGLDGDKIIPLAQEKENFLRFRKHEFPAQELDGLRLTVLATRGDRSARVYQIRAYESPDI